MRRSPRISLPGPAAAVRWYPEMSADLSIARMDFAEYADAADPSGTFRGLGDG
ncbi:DUF6924 domain-containing protein [Streptomyces iakyrus]|uniref:DUF6924 domain-containing protein n=1 Tax=Streptomyces iakyrus TaxID=68219 RepID=UPI00367D8349